MKLPGYLILAAGLDILAASPVIAQTAASQSAPAKQKTQDGNSPTTVGPGSKAYKQQSQANNAGATKQKTQGDLPEVGPASGAYSGNTPHSKY